MGPPTVLQIATSALTPYVTNCNTGNVYEIWHILVLVRQMGLTNEDIITLEPMFQSMESLGRGNIGTLANIPKILAMPIGTGLRFHGHPIKNIRNATQTDGDGGTGDLILICQDEREFSISVTGKINVKKIEKCLTNPSCRRLGCSDAEMALIKEIEKAAPAQLEQELIGKFGADRNTWPSTKRLVTTTATSSANRAAQITVDRFNALPAEEKRRVMNDVHHLERAPADYLCIVSRNKLIYYHFGAPTMDKDTWIPRAIVRGIYIDVFHEEKQISFTQVKFNNGIGSSLRSSWNLNAMLTNLYNMTLISSPFV